MIKLLVKSIVITYAVKRLSRYLRNKPAKLPA